MPGAAPTIALVGTLDTKGDEYGFLRDRVVELGGETVLIDVGVLGEPRIAPDVGHEEVARAGGGDLGELAGAGDRGAAMATMGRGASAVLRRMLDEGRLDGVVSVGGSGNASVAAEAVRD